MCYVYLLVSVSHPNQHYIGMTRDLKKRVQDHNIGRSKHTAKFAPWMLAAYFAFAQEKTAIAFERYLKSGSGKTFLKRHLLPESSLRFSSAKATADSSATYLWASVGCRWAKAARIGLKVC